MKRQPSLCRRRVDPFAQALKVSALCFEIAHDLNQMRQGAPKAIQLPDSEHVARLQTRKQLVEFRALGRRPRHLVSNNLFASRRLQGIALRVGVLIDG